MAHIPSAERSPGAPAEDDQEGLAQQVAEADRFSRYGFRKREIGRPIAYMQDSVFPRHNQSPFL
jgi:hypothetical protein